MSECGGSCGSECGGCPSAGGCCGEEKVNHLAGVKQAVLVMSGKGGVGKSTVAASLAVALARKGKQVGLLDVDFHGPSQPTLFGVAHQRAEGSENGILPLEAAGVKLMSVGLILNDPDAAVIWRGPAKTGAIKQLLEDTCWGDLDFLILDFPPGTGDESLSACQLIDIPKIAVVVTTPQEVALADCRKCVDFCRQLKVPVAGIVENMSGFVCPDCEARHALYGSGGGQKLADKAEVPLLAEIPLDPAFLKSCDFGELASGLDASSAVCTEIDRIAAALIGANESKAD